VERGKGRRVEG